MRYQALFAIGCVCLMGCTPLPEPTASPEPATTPAAESTTPETNTTEAAAAAIPEAAAPAESEAAAPPVAAAVEPAPAPETERVKAAVGVGKKGRSLDGESGMIVTPVKAFFSVQEKLAFEVQLRKALDLYKATNGNFPKSQAEFDTHIASQVKLPQLPAGHKYVYDPQQGELQVERPK